MTSVKEGSYRMSSTSTTENTPVESEHRLRGNLGPVAIIVMVIAAAAPLTVVGGVVPIGFLLGNGIGLPLMFMVATAIVLLFAVGMVAMSRYVPRSGSFFAFVAHGLGRTPGTGTAYLALLTYTAAQIAVFSYFGATLSGSIVHLGGPEIPWWLFTLVGMIVVGFLGYHRIELSAKVLSIVLLAEMGIMVVLGVVILAVGGAEGVSYESFAFEHILSGSPALGLMFALAGFIGFESTVVYRGEARDPDRTIPRATYWAGIIIGVFYTFAAWVIVVGWGASNLIEESAADPATLLARLTGIYLGPVGFVIIDILFMGSMFAAVLSLHNVLTRYLHFMSIGRLMPAPLRRVHERFGSPHVAAVVQISVASALVVLFMLFGLPAAKIFAWGAGIATISIVILMALTCAAVIVYFARRPNDLSPWHRIIAPGLAFIGLTIGGYLIATNFPLLAEDVNDAGEPTWGVLSIVLLGIVAVVALVGLVQARVLKARNREAYEQITENLDAAAS